MIQKFCFHGYFFPLFHFTNNMTIITLHICLLLCWKSETCMKITLPYAICSSHTICILYMSTTATKSTKLQFKNNAGRWRTLSSYTILSAWWGEILSPRHSECLKLKVKVTTALFSDWCVMKSVCDYLRVLKMLEFQSHLWWH